MANYMRAKYTGGFVHNGFAIIVTETGQFVAKTPTGAVKSRSLDGLRKQLDKLSPFKPFRAFVWGWVYDGPRHVGRHRWVNVEIVGTYRDGPRRRLWVDKLGKKYPEVFVDTEANRIAAREWRVEVRDGERNRKTWEKRARTALELCERVRP